MSTGPIIVTRRRLTPLLPETPERVAHVAWDGKQMVVLRGPAWTQNGVVGQVPRTAGVPGGAGPFSDAQFYSVDPQPDVLDFAGDFSVCVVYDSLAIQNNNGLVGNAAPFGASGAGWRLMESTGALTFDTLGPGSTFTRASTLAAAVGTMNVVCIGRTGSTQVIKANLQTLVSTAGSLVVPATAQPARIGRYAEANVAALQKRIFEIWAAPVTPSDALFIALMQRVKQRLRITTW